MNVESSAIRLGTLLLTTAVAMATACDNLSDALTGDGADAGAGSPAGKADWPGSGDEAPSGTTSTALAVSATEGGSVALESGWAAVEIPAGALSDDTTITIEAQPPEADTLSGVYDFGPDGTTFNTPVQISLAFDGDVPEGKEAVLAWQDGTQWVHLAGSQLAGGKVSAPVEHFTRFAVVLRDGAFVVTSSCGDLADSFTACGGDVMGEWSMGDLCFDEAFMADAGELGEQCPGASVNYEVEWTGSVSFDGTRMTRRFDSAEATSEMTIPHECLPAGATCDLMSQGSDDQGSCVDTGSACQCTYSDQDLEMDVEQDAYQIDNTTMVVTSEDGEVTRVPYCVRGAELVLKVEPEEAGEPGFYLVLERR